jgi:hypothetical protein
MDLMVIRPTPPNWVDTLIAAAIGALVLSMIAMVH